VLLMPLPAASQKLFTIQKDSIPLFKGFAISFNAVGAARKALSTYGEYEGALRINLHNQYFPIIELGYGIADHDDEVTGIYYKTQAPYFRIGCDLNLLKNKHSKNRLYGGLRYAFTSYKVDISRQNVPDPVWLSASGFAVEGDQCSMHWAEVVFGIDAYLWGPLHIGWDVRYKRRIAHKDLSIGTPWYVPGYGENGDTRLGANFNIIIDI
jgi:hypothetical protein